MKKLMAICFLAAAVTAQAQLQPVLKNKRGISILPQKGDFCIGISANPFFEYFGNMFNSQGNNVSPNFTPVRQLVYGKYMKSAHIAYRGSLSIDVNNTSYSYTVRDLSPGASADAMVADKYKMSASILGLSIGMEKRRGDTRLQGYYGADLLLTFSANQSGKVEYGNKIEYYDTGFSRQVSFKGPSEFTFGILAFAGVEYFIAPRISIGGELSMGPSVRFRGKSSYKRESYDFNTSESVKKETKLDVRSTDFKFGNNAFGNGALKVLFYF
jgi:hypothetical protein